MNTTPSKVNMPTNDEGLPASSPFAGPIIHEKILTSDEMKHLTIRSNKLGLVRLLGHTLIMICSGSIYGWAIISVPTGIFWSSCLISIPFLMLLGFTYASMFACMHECLHRTAFKNNKLNDCVAWMAGFLSFYNSAFFRYSHGSHHRFTQTPGKDPELDDPKPTTKIEYFLEVIGFFWWGGKITTHINTALGLFRNYPYIPKGGRLSVTRSIRIQIFTYFCIFAVSTYLAIKELTTCNVFLFFWLLPLAVGQPFLRMILLADHTACTSDSNFLTNTRTTYTHPLVRFLMWEMPFHAEHHNYPMIPFHALAKVHEKLKPHLEFVMIDGFIGAQRQIIENFPQSKK